MGEISDRQVKCEREKDRIQRFDELMFVQDGKLLYFGVVVLC